MPFTTLTGLRIKAPTRGTRNWDAVVLTDTWTPISQHQHTGDPDGLQIPSGGIADNAITGAKIRLANEEYLRARNAANDGDVNILRVNSSDVPEFGVSGSSISLAGNNSTDILLASDVERSVGNATNKLLRTHQQEDRLYGSTSGYVGLRSADTVSTPYTVKLPDAEGSVGQLFRIASVSSNVVDLEFASESTVANQDVVARSADYTVLDGDDVGVILMTTSSTDRTVTLPTAADNANRVITIKKVDSGSGSVIVDGEGAETIDGAASYTVFEQFGSVTVGCNGTSWAVLNGLVSYYNKEVLDLTGSVNYTGGSLLVERVNQQVMVTALVTPTHGSDASPESASGFIPSWARPSVDQRNCYLLGGAFIATCEVESDGTFATVYRDYSGSASAQTSAGVPCSICYSVGTS